MAGVAEIAKKAQQADQLNLQPRRVPGQTAQSQNPNPPDGRTPP